MTGGDHASGAAPSDDFTVDPLDIVDPVALEGITVPPRRWLLPDWIPLGSVTAIYGTGGVGKSQLAQQLMTSCAVGLPFLEMPVMRCRAFGIFCEDSKDELHRRQARINETLGIDWADLADMRWVSRIGSENLLQIFTADGRGRLTTFYDQILAAAQDIGAQLLILDTVSDMYGGNENIRSQVRQFISSALMQIAQAIDGAVVLLAHPSQSGRDSGRGDGGSTAWINSIRSHLYFNRLEGDDADADPNVRVITRTKSNYAIAGDAITVAYHDGLFVRKDRGVAGTTVLRTAEAERVFLAGLGDLNSKNFRVSAHPGVNFAPKMIRKLSTAAAGFSESELTAAMNRLFKTGTIRSVQDGSPSRRRSRLEAAPTLGLDEPVQEVAP